MIAKVERMNMRQENPKEGQETKTMTEPQKESKNVLLQMKKNMNNRSAQTYEWLTEDPELKTLDSQLREAKQKETTLQVQLKLLSVVERMKISQEQHTAQQQVHAIQSRVMEVNQRLQPIHDEACQLFEEIEGRGAELEQVVTVFEQCSEGPINEVFIQEFAKQEALPRQQVKEARANIEDIETELPRSEWLRTSHKGVLGAYFPLT